ncbi:MAG: T9SS type A sorting domain-containing protein, partial [candidate division Zixibacteria bacterium]|nr:T9SS type A sorting domain-containing protein [candidate division Zixibacteria bacterium]
SEIIRIFVYKLTDIPYEPERFPWPMSCHDPQHTNNLTHRVETSIPAYDEQTGLPRRALLHGNHPNPFNASTKIEFGIPKNGYVNLKVYNILGQEVAELTDEKLTAGEYSVDFNGDELSSGLYFYNLKYGDNKTISRKMLLLK